MIRKDKKHLKTVLQKHRSVLQKAIALIQMLHPNNVPLKVSAIWRTNPTWRHSGQK